MSTIPTRSRSLRKPAVGINRSDEKQTSALPGLTKPQDVSTTARATSPSKLPMKATTASHMRTTSSVNSRFGVTNSTAVSRPPRSITTRPPISSDNARPLSLRSKTPDAPSSTAGTASSLQRKSSTGSTSAPRHLRNASTSSISTANRAPVNGHARTNSLNRQSAQDGTIRPPSQTKVLRPPSQNQILAPPSSHALVQAPTATAQTSRPTFTTLQQHYSPAKNLAPKPATSTFLAAPSPSKLPSNIAITAETAKLQAELLQLHLLHKDANTVQNEWEASARMELGKVWADVKDRSEGLRDDEAREEERRNTLALKVWKDSSVPGWGLEEKVQVLDEVLSGIWKFSEQGSRYARSVKRFEKWLEAVERTLELRRRGEQIQLDSNGLDSQWRNECEGMARKLGAWRERILNLGDVDRNGSALAGTVHGCQSLAEGLHAEVQSMLRIELEIRIQEREWISKMCDEDSDDDGDVGRTAGGAWRL